MSRRNLDWEWVRLQDIIFSSCSGGTPPTNKIEYYKNGTIPWLNTKEVKGYIYNTENHITELGLKNSSAKLIDKNSIIIAMYGVTAGQVAINKIKLTTNQACFNLTLNKEKTDYKFIYYFLFLNKNLLNSSAHGSAQRNLNSSIIKNIQIQIPPLKEQKKISHLLSLLDDKIQNNKKIIAELEGLASSIYMHFFFRKESNAKLGELIKENKKSTIKAGDGKDTVGQYPFFTSGEDIYKWDEALVDGRNCFLNTGGNADVKFYVGKAAYSTDTWCIAGKNDMSEYLYLLLHTIKKELNIKYFQGTSLKHLQKELLRKRDIYIPNDSEIKNFNTIIKPAFDEISKSIRENQNLSQLRDFLLPMLMNSQVVVRD